MAWLIPVFPFLAFLAIAAGARRWPAASAGLTILAIGAAFVASCLVFLEVYRGVRVDVSYGWLPIPMGPALPLGLLVDPLTAIMLVVVTSVSLLVQIYSTGYMHGDTGYARYFAFMALFTMSMLGLVLANNLLAIYIFWELVGLCSYLLIGHWHERPEAAAAAKKAFIVTRFGDVGFLLGILFLFWHTGTFQFTVLEQMARDGRLAGPMLTVGILLIFCGAIGKSAQFPLHVWLPDAMEGPTPVSALIHAATMVAAGVYLMARTTPLLEHSAAALAVVAVAGGFTAFFAATMGLVSTDIKRVLAYSTVSQLGYMLLAIGVGATSAGMFHLFNHAFFKALLFLCAGSLIHLVGTNELFQMGGLARWRPVTLVAMTVAALSLAGVPPFSGFWSKDEILVAASSAQPVLFVLALATVFLTAFYMFRVILLAFTGNPRSEMHGHGEPPAMMIPLVILLVPSAVSGLWGAPQLGNGFGAFLGGGHVAGHAADPIIPLVSTAIGLAGILLTFAMYGGGRVTAGARLTATFRPIHTLLVNRYYVDHLYNWLVGSGVLGIGWLANRFDILVIDGIVNGTGRTVIGLGSALRRAQTGQVQTYAWALFAGVLTLALLVVLTQGVGAMR
jgi:NADH-quinone oxidoreductase subunit L